MLAPAAGRAVGVVGAVANTVDGVEAPRLGFRLDAQPPRNPALELDSPGNPAFATPGYPGSRGSPQDDPNPITPQFGEAGCNEIAQGGVEPNPRHLNFSAGPRRRRRNPVCDSRPDPGRGIEVDDYLQTRSRNIWAVVDVLQRHLYTHAAIREAEVVYQNALLVASRRIDYSALPRVTFTDPEVASVGSLDPDAFGNRFGDLHTLRVEYRDVDRARIDGQTLGFAKVLATGSGKILGATILGAEAGTVLQEFVLAMEHGLTLADIAETVHPYPTYAGLARDLADQYAAIKHESGFLRSAVRFFHGYQPRRRARASAAPTTISQSAAAHHAGH